MIGRTFPLAVLVALLTALPPARGQEAAVTVFAAASLKNAVDDVDVAFTRATGLRVVASYAASSALARQIEGGAPADLLISADRAWMDYLAQRNLIRRDTRFDLLGNRLVLIAPADSGLTNVAIARGFDLAALAGNGRIAVGDVRAVPAGRYARAALEALGAWAAAQPRLAQVENVRAALALVSRGEAPLGIVYATDAAIDPGVKVVGVFPERSHPPVIYPAALTANANPAAQRYLDFLRSATALVIFERHGFRYLVKAGP